MNMARLYKIDNNIVFYSLKLGSVRQEYYEGLNREINPMIGYATNGTEMEAKDAIKDLVLMADLSIPSTRIEKIHRNSVLAPIMITLVKEEIVDYPDGLVYLSKLESAIGALQTGSFNTASIILLSLEPDTVLTEERLSRWSDLCLSADALGDY